LQKATLRRSRQIGEDEADTRVKRIGVLLDLRHDPSGFFQLCA